MQLQFHPGKGKIFHFFFANLPAFFPIKKEGKAWCLVAAAAFGKLTSNHQALLKDLNEKKIHQYMVHTHTSVFFPPSNYCCH